MVDEGPMRTLVVVLAAALSGCASQTGIMWGYISQSQRLSELEVLAFARARSACEKSLSADQRNQAVTPLLEFKLPEACSSSQLSMPRSRSLPPT
jgi:hypothetical protein